MCSACVGVSAWSVRLSLSCAPIALRFVVVVVVWCLCCGDVSPIAFLFLCCDGGPLLRTAERKRARSHVSDRCAFGVRRCAGATAEYSLNMVTWTAVYVRTSYCSSAEDSDSEATATEDSRRMRWNLYNVDTAMLISNGSATFFLVFVVARCFVGLRTRCQVPSGCLRCAGEIACCCWLEKKEINEEVEVKTKKTFTNCSAYVTNVGPSYIYTHQRPGSIRPK